MVCWALSASTWVRANSAQGAPGHGMEKLVEIECGLHVLRSATKFPSVNSLRVRLPIQAEMGM